MKGQEKQKNYVTVVVDGLIGSGKSTLLKKCLLPRLLERGLSVTIVDEPVEKWKESGLLEAFYNDPKGWASIFQMKAFHDRVREMQEKHSKYASTTDVFLLERSHFTDSLFVKVLHKTGVIGDLQYQIYQEWWSLWEEVVPLQPDLFVYLRPSLEVVMERVQERARLNETSGVTEDYQQKLQEVHDDFLGSGTVKISDSHYVPSIVIKDDSNFRDNDEVQKRFTDQFEELIMKLKKAKR